MIGNDNGNQYENLIFGGFKGIWTYPASESRLQAKHMERLREEIGQILDCCVSRRNKVVFSHSEIIHERVMDIIFEITEHDIINGVFDFMKDNDFLGYPIQLI